MVLLLLCSLEIIREVKMVINSMLAKKKKEKRNKQNKASYGAMPLLELNQIHGGSLQRYQYQKGGFY